MAPKASVHSPRYLQFLKSAWEEAVDLGRDRGRDGDDLLSKGFRPEGTLYPASLLGRIGYHIGDLSCPIGEGVLEVAAASADAAVHAAELVLGGERVAFALCHLPGHHAHAERANARCYLNNAAIAAQVLRRKFERVVVVDIEAQHGSGTQSIFYARADVLTVSIHLHPSFSPPYSTGYCVEDGIGDGVGYNVNFPLLPDQLIDGLLYYLRTAIGAVEEFAPGAMVVSFGIDSFAEDDRTDLCLTQEGMSEAMMLLSRLGLPTVLVQEGIPACDDQLVGNIKTVLDGFESRLF